MKKKVIFTEYNGELSRIVSILMLQFQQPIDKTELSLPTTYSLLDSKLVNYDPNIPTHINYCTKSVTWVKAETDAWLHACIEYGRCQIRGRLS